MLCIPCCNFSNWCLSRIMAFTRENKLNYIYIILLRICLLDHLIFLLNINKMAYYVEYNDHDYGFELF